MNMNMIESMWRKMDGEPGAGGAGAVETPAPTDTPMGGEGGAADDDAAEEPKADETAPVEGGAADEPKEEKKSGSLLDDDATDEGAAEVPKADEGVAKEPTEEEIAAWVKDVPALDLGDGVKWDDAALKAMAPSLMGLKKEDSNKVITAYAEYTKKIAKAQAVAADAFNAGLIKQCEERFGTDLRKVAGFAKKGGAAIFGDKIWNELKTVPSFANNPDIIERLAAYGRTIADDGGKVKADAGGTKDAQADVLHRMYGGIRV